jgi:hypothetical protein
MDKYSNQINTSELIVNNIYKITTSKNTFLVKFIGKNKNEGMHFVIVSSNTSNGHTIVLQDKDIVSLFTE